jgi:UDPglucose--hexose-1-phosphate uridylyltransferase
MVSHQRLRHPWLCPINHPSVAPRPASDPDCYLCPGNALAGGPRNPAYFATIIFSNDMAALHPHVGRDSDDGHPLLQSQSLPGGVILTGA